MSESNPLQEIARLAKAEQDSVTGIRGKCRRLALSIWFERIVLLMIIISSVCLAIESPYNDPNSFGGILLSVLDMFLLTLFAIEMTVKMIGFGFWQLSCFQLQIREIATNKSFDGNALKFDVRVAAEAGQPYFRVAWNWIDFIVVVSGFAEFILMRTFTGDMGFLRLVRAMRVFRVMRPLRLVKRNKGMRVIVEAIIAAIPVLANMVLIAMLFYIGFSILFVNLLKGKLWHCSLDPTGSQRPDIVVKDGCLAAGGTWVNADSNFDNIGNSLVSLLHVGTSEGWLQVMRQVTRAVGIDYQPRRNASPEFGLLLIGVVALTNFFLMNLFIGVLIDQHMVTKAELTKLVAISTEERRWLQVQGNIVLNPDRWKPEPLSFWDITHPTAKSAHRAKGPRVLLQWLLKSKGFEVFLFFCVVFNTFLLCISNPTDDEEMIRLLDGASMLFITFFLVEAGLKLYAFRIYYFADRWNVFDLVIAIGSFVSMLTDLVPALKGSDFSNVVRAFRICRVLRLARWVTFLNLISNLVGELVVGLSNFASLLFLLLYVYACLGVGLFGTTMDCQDCSNGMGLGRNANFHSFGNAFCSAFVVRPGRVGTSSCSILQENSLAAHTKYRLQRISRLTGRSVVDRHMRIPIS
jgi:hypothetical protein